MYLPARLGLLCLLFALAVGQKSKGKSTQPQGRTLGFLSPLLLGAGGPLFDVPIAPVGTLSGGSIAGTAGGSGTQSDQFYGGAGGRLVH